MNYEILVSTIHVKQKALCTVADIAKQFPNEPLSIGILIECWR